MPHNAETEARGKLRWLQQSGGILNYVEEFMSLILEVEGLLDKDALFYFKDGLKDWA